MPKNYLISHSLSNSNSALFFNNQFSKHLFQENHISNILLFLFKLAIISSLPLVTAQTNDSNILGETNESSSFPHNKQAENDGYNSNILGLIMLLSLLMLMLLLRLLFTSKIFNSYCYSNDEYKEIFDKEIQHNYGAANQIQIELPNITSISTHSCPSNEIEWSGNMKYSL